jgi:hypothetical protein
MPLRAVGLLVTHAEHHGISFFAEPTISIFVDITNKTTPRTKVVLDLINMLHGDIHEVVFVSRVKIIIQQRTSHKNLS